MSVFPSLRCSPPIPTRTMTGATKTWTPWRRRRSTSWRRGWRGWTCSPWSWRKVQNIVKSPKPLILISALIKAVLKGLLCGHVLEMILDLWLNMKHETHQKSTSNSLRAWSHYTAVFLNIQILSCSSATLCHPPPPPRFPTRQRKCNGAGFPSIFPHWAIFPTSPQHYGAFIYL